MAAVQLGAGADFGPAAAKLSFAFSAWAEAAQLGTLGAGGNVLRKFVVVMVATICCLSAAADDLYEYGSSAELKGVTKYYVDAGEDLDLRNILAERLGASGVTIAERPEDAEHWVIFRWSGSFWTRTIVIKRVGARHRLLMTYRGEEAELDDLASDAGKAIAKRLREINGTK